MCKCKKNIDNDFLLDCNCCKKCGCRHCCKKILIVGGVTKLKRHYKDLIESYNFEFMYHDGYVKSGVKKLEKMVKKVDIILCPLNCNSHGACKLTKKFCKKYKKCCKFVKSSGVATLREIIFESV